MSGVSKYKVGDEFSNGKRLVEKVGSHPKFRTTLWIWECTNCGQRHGPSLTNSITRLDRGPRCCYLPKLQNNHNWKGYEDIPGKLYSQFRDNAARRGLEFSVSIEQLWDAWKSQEGRCRYSGRLLSLGHDASLDRRDNLIGYTLDNVQWVHKDVNRMKSNFSEEYFLEMCKDIGVKNATQDHI